MATVRVPHGVAVRSGKIFADHFGVNFISNKDEAPGGGALEAYQAAVTDLSSGGRVSVRFPGGGVAENADGGNAFTVLDDGAVTPGTHTWEFLEDAAANGWSVSIVLPTWRFLDLDAMEMDIGRAEQDVAEYARSLFAAAHALGVTIDGFEIGNEFDLMAEKTNGSAWLDGNQAEAFSDAYAGLAAAMTAVLDDEIGAAGYGAKDAPWIGVQALWTWIPEDWRKAVDFRAALEQAFTAEGALDAVDAVITHIYPWLELEQNPANWLAGDTHIVDTLAAVDAVFGGGLDWVVSEWEVSFGSGDAIEVLRDHYDGIKQLDPVMALFTQMVTAGVDHMNIWPVRNGAFTALETLEGAEKPASYLFDLMRDQLVGTTVLDLNGAAAGVMWEAGKGIHGYGFEDDGRTLFYLGSRSATETSLALDLSAYRGTGAAPAIAVTRILVDDPEAKGYQQGVQVLAEEYGWAEFQANAGDILTFSPYEMIVVEVIYELAAGEVETGTAGNDFVFGTSGDDALRGKGGDDWLYGQRGADMIDGGGGNDLIRGGGDSDLIFGGAGDDVVEGGAGQDIVDLGGGADLFRDDDQWQPDGNDVADGGAGDDRFLAGRGDDVFTGGTGADIFEFGTVTTKFEEDLIADFTPGEDVLRINGADYADVAALAADFRVYAADGDTVVQVVGQGWITLAGVDATGIAGVRDAPEFLVVNGSSGADAQLGGTPFDARISGRGGADGLYGRAGDDRLYGGGGADWLYGGAGDDRLVDGGGADRLYGGDGADVFRFRLDGRTDRLFDFTQGEDVIDLRDWGLDGIDRLDFGLRDGGWLAIGHGAEVILVAVDDPAGFAFTAADFLM